MNVCNESNELMCVFRDTEPLLSTSSPVFVLSNIWRTTRVTLTCTLDSSNRCRCLGWFSVTQPTWLRLWEMGSRSIHTRKNEMQLFVFLYSSRHTTADMYICIPFCLSKCFFHADSWQSTKSVNKMSKWNRPQEEPIFIKSQGAADDPWLFSWKCRNSDKTTPWLNQLTGTSCCLSVQMFLHPVWSAPKTVTLQIMWHKLWSPDINNVLFCQRVQLAHPRRHQTGAKDILEQKSETWLGRTLCVRQTISDLHFQTASKPFLCLKRVQQQINKHVSGFSFCPSCWCFIFPQSFTFCAVLGGGVTSYFTLVCTVMALTERRDTKRKKSQNNLLCRETCCKNNQTLSMMVCISIIQ